MCIYLSSSNLKFIRGICPLATIIALGSFQEGYIFSEIAFLFYIIYYDNTIKKPSNWLQLYSSLFLFGCSVGSLLTTLLVAPLNN